MFSAVDEFLLLFSKIEFFSQNLFFGLSSKSNQHSNYFFFFLSLQREKITFFQISKKYKKFFSAELWSVDGDGGHKLDKFSNENKALMRCWQNEQERAKKSLHRRWANLDWIFPHFSQTSSLSFLTLLSLRLSLSMNVSWVPISLELKCLQRNEGVQWQSHFSWPHFDDDDDVDDDDDDNVNGNDDDVNGKLFYTELTTYFTKLSLIIVCVDLTGESWCCKQRKRGKWVCVRECASLCEWQREKERYRVREREKYVGALKYHSWEFGCKI